MEPRKRHACNEQENEDQRAVQRCSGGAHPRNSCVFALPRRIVEEIDCALRHGSRIAHVAIRKLRETFAPPVIMHVDRCRRGCPEPPDSREAQ